MRSLTCIVVAGLVAGGLWLAAGSAGAVVPGAADLAADCNDDGSVVVTKHSHYHGGTGLITQDCRVDISPGARLTLTKVTLVSKCCFFVISPAGHDSDVLVLDSRTDLAGALQLVSGCCAGEPGEENGRVRVRRSNLVASSVEVGASVNNPDGYVDVRDSRLEATTASIGPSIHIWASHGSFGGSDGTAVVVNSELITPDRIRIATGSRGDTEARANLFTAGGTVVITTGPDGTCSSVGNVPDVPCT